MKIKGHSFIWVLITWVLSLWDGDVRATAYCMCYYKTAAIPGVPDSKGWTEVVVTNRASGFDCTTMGPYNSTESFYSSCGYMGSGGSGSSSGYSCGVSVNRVACTTGGDTTGRPGGSLEGPFPQVQVTLP